MTHDAVTDGFEELYRGETTLGGFLLDTVPWDIGEPQPAVVALEEGRLVVDDVLDVGCGPGDNALYLAERGHRVTACDAAPSAVASLHEDLDPVYEHGSAPRRWARVPVHWSGLRRPKGAAPEPGH